MERDGYEADKQRLMIADVERPADVLTVNGIMDITDGFKYNASVPVWSDDSQGIFFASLAEGLQGIFEAKQEDGSWKINRITPDSLWYDFSSPFHVEAGEDGSRTIYTTWCSMDFPSEIVAVKAGPEGVSCRQVTDENGHILSKLEEHRTQARMIKTSTAKICLHGCCILRSSTRQRHIRRFSYAWEARREP